MNRRCIALAFAAVAGGAAAAEVTYRIDPTHTFIVFEADHHGTSTLRGRFERNEGTVVIDREKHTGRVEITSDAAAISTGVAVLDARLKGKDFFNAAESPELKFVADRVSFDGDKVAAVAGTLTLLGKPLPLTLTATHFNCYTNPLLKREVCGGDFAATVQRSLWGMTQGLEAGVPDGIRVLVQVEAVRQSADDARRAP